MEIKPKRGMQFIHSYEINRDGKPETCTVTRVTQYWVYYRNTTGFLSKTTHERFPILVTEVC